MPNNVLIVKHDKILAAPLYDGMSVHRNVSNYFFFLHRNVRNFLLFFCFSKGYVTLYIIFAVILFYYKSPFVVRVVWRVCRATKLVHGHH